MMGIFCLSVYFLLVASSLYCLDLVALHADFICLVLFLLSFDREIKLIKNMNATTFILRRFDIVRCHCQVQNFNDDRTIYIDILQ